ncbi:MAG: Coq4 family protein [Burkholderiales bacterium]
METLPRFASRRIQPIVALQAFRRLIRDPEDTHQVFMIGEALRGNSLARVTTRFLATPLGPQVVAGRHRLLPILADREALARLPAGSLGRTYLDFVIAESLSAQGLAEAARRRDEMSEATAEEKGFRVHLRDSHDLWHVLTGYGRDPLGEICLLAFTYAQTGLNGLGLISFVGSLRIARELRDQPVRAAVREGRAMGRTAQWLPGIDWSSMLARDLSEVRRELRFSAPETYRAIGRALAPQRLAQTASVAQ